MDSYTIGARSNSFQVNVASGYYIDMPAVKFSNHVMEPRLFTLYDHDTDPELDMHSGNEFDLVLEGDALGNGRLQFCYPHRWPRCILPC
jgi:hypothetical protein